MEKTYTYGRQAIGEDDISAVIEVLEGDWLTQGPKVSEFERELAAKFGSKHATAVANGTAGLHLIALGLGWKEGDIIITSPITFVASANSAVYVKARPDFVDIDPRTYTIDVGKLEEKIKAIEGKGRRIKAVVAVDYAGHPCDWRALRTLASKHEFQLVNDYCHALGAEYGNDVQYAAKFADAVNISFHPVKHITTGEGGAVLSNDKEFDSRIKAFRTHGITKDPKLLEKNDGPWYYEMQQLGFNYRITDFQCALGLSQLKKLDGFIAERRKVAKHYDSSFGDDTRFITPHVTPGSKHAYHLYPLQIEFDRISLRKKELFDRLKTHNISCQVHYIPVHLQPYYRRHYGFQKGDFPVAERFYEREISIPMYPGLTEEDLAYISSTLLDIVH